LVALLQAVAARDDDGNDFALTDCTVSGDATADGDDFVEVTVAVKVSRCRLLAGNWKYDNSLTYSLHSPSNNKRETIQPTY
jgi:hypothetical protein